jgi:hypothetical protein
MNCILYISAVLSCLGSAAVAQTQSAPREDDGKALLERICTKCHKLEGTLSQRNSKERWSAIVDDMVARGAEATDAEIDRLLDYLAKNYGNKVNVNKATAERQVADARHARKSMSSCIR